MGYDDVKNVISDDLYQRARFYNERVAHYVMRRYQIHNRGSSDIKEDEDIPLRVKENLQDSVNRYKSTDYFSTYSPYATAPNRREQLKAALTNEMIKKCSKLAPLDFLSTCALYVLLAYDLRILAGFDGALECAIDAMTEATVMSEQLWFLDVWRP